MDPRPVKSWMRLISVKMSDAPVHGIDELVKRGIYQSRTAVMRVAGAVASL